MLLQPTDEGDWFLAAPGFDIRVGGFSGNGTSQATAHCSGVAALMYSKGPCAFDGWGARQTIYWNAVSHDWGWPYCPLGPQPRHVNALWAVNATPATSCVCRGDCNGSGAVTFADTDYFVAALGDNETAWRAMFAPGEPTCPFANCDANGDGHVNFSDIDPFAALLGTECPVEEEADDPDQGLDEAEL